MHGSARDSLPSLFNVVLKPHADPSVSGAASHPAHSAALLVACKFNEMNGALHMSIVIHAPHIPGPIPRKPLTALHQVVATHHAMSLDCCRPLAAPPSVLCNIKTHRSLAPRHSLTKVRPLVEECAKHWDQLVDGQQAMAGACLRGARRFSKERPEQSILLFAPLCLLLLGALLWACCLLRPRRPMLRKDTTQQVIHIFI